MLAEKEKYPSKKRTNIYILKWISPRYTYWASIMSKVMCSLWYNVSGMDSLLKHITVE